MATFFGEVILPSSRAFLDDKDDSDSENDESDTTITSRQALQVTVKDNASLEKTYDFLILSDGQIAKDFIDNYIQGEKQVIAEFTTSPDHELHDETEMIYSKKLSKKPTLCAVLYSINERTLYLEASRNLQLKIVNQLTLALEDWLEKCCEVVIFASRPVSECRGDLSMQESFVRSLATSVHSLPPSAFPMEQPNFISGAAASVMSWCEVKKIKCLLHVCFTDMLFCDSTTLAPLLQSVTNSSISSLIQAKSPDHLKHKNPIHLNVMYQ